MGVSNGGGLTDSVGGLFAVRRFNHRAGDFTGLVTLDSGNTLYSAGDGDMEIFHDAITMTWRLLG